MRKRPEIRFEFDVTAPPACTPQVGNPIILGRGEFAPADLWTQAKAALRPTPPQCPPVSEDAWQRIAQAEQFVHEICTCGWPVYGVNTGVGHFSDVLIPKNHTEKFQENLIRSHCCGVGEPLGRDVVFAMWLLRLQTICLGHSGLRVETVRAILTLLEAGVLAEVPSRGSVGASGDLAPSAHAALVLLGEGWCTVPRDGRFLRLRSAEAIQQVGVDPVRLQAKEALALINGTQLTTALAIKAWHGASQLLRTANLAVALCIEAFHGSHQPLDPRVLRLHGHDGTFYCGDEIRWWLDGQSEIRDATDGLRWSQDPYCLRCAPQVHGAVWDELRQTEDCLRRTMRSCADNPLLFPADCETRSCGNFHGIYTARACDRLASAVATLASMSERRTNMAMDSRRTGLPDFLIPDGGLQSGLMMAHVTAAALVSECKALSFPASVDSIPTNNDQEDHVPMGPTAAFKALAIIEKARWVLAIELLAVAQALDLRLPLTPVPRLQAVRDLIRRDVATLTDDRVLSEDMMTLAERIAEGRYLEICPTMPND